MITQDRILKKINTAKLLPQPSPFVHATPPTQMAPTVELQNSVFFP